MENQIIEIIQPGQELQTQQSSALLNYLVAEGKQGRKLPGYNATTIQSITSGYFSQIRRIPEHAQDELVGASIRQFAESYGDRKGIDGEVLSECIDLIIEHFGHLGVMEIRTAYQLWSLRKINGAEMWGGEFNALQLGRVLSDYSKYRKKVITELINERDRIKTEEDKQRLIEARNQQAREDFHLYIENAKTAYEDGTGFASWEKIWGNWYDRAIEEGLINPTQEEKRPFWDKAKKIAKSQVNQEVADLFASKRQAEARARKKEFEPDTELFKRKAATIAKKMMVHELIIKKLTQ